MSRDLLDHRALADGLRMLPEWQGDRIGIERSIELPSFRAAIVVVTAVADIAEEMDHHPDIDIRWRTLTFRNATHTAGGVTALDLELARRIDDVIASQSS
jgi:4a-hydroxytetrahydrobiopterin dehydratase